MYLSFVVVLHFPKMFHTDVCLCTIVNCVDAWMIALELDHCVFTSLDVGIQMRCGRINHSLRIYSFLLIQFRSRWNSALQILQSFILYASVVLVVF